MTQPVIQFRDGLITLADSVRNYFKVLNISAQVLPVGLKYRSLWASSRVVFVPGEFDGTDTTKPLREGRLTAPQHMKSDNPRELVTWERVATVCVYAFDPSAPSNEQAQIEAATLLLEQTIQAMWNASRTPPTPPGLPGTKEFGLAGQASLRFDDGTVTRAYPPSDLGYGAELLVTFTQLGPLFDTYQPTVVPGLGTLVKVFNGQSPP